VAGKKKMKNFIKELENPRIHTLDEVFALELVEPDPEDLFCNNDPHGRVVEAVVDRIGTRFSGPHDIGVLTHGERCVLEITAMMGEVLNGGFHQYLWNSSGDSAELTKGMLRDIGATTTAGMLDRVSGFFPNGRIPEAREERCRLIEEFEEKNPEVELFSEEDMAFYRSEENLYKLLAEYVANRRDEFVEPADAIVRKYKRRDRIREHLGVEDDPSALEEAEKTLQAIEAQCDAILGEFRQEQLNLIKKLLVEGRKKDAVKTYRLAFDCSLPEAKAAVEAMNESG
jgi:hypothetical protein